MNMHINLYYPNVDIKDRKQDQPIEVSIGLEHVRAADNIIVDYDFDRDGYRIRMRERPPGEDNYSVSDDECPLKEVAFVPAWLDAPSEPNKE